MDSITLSSILKYFSTANSIEFYSINFYHLEEFGVKQTDYKIKEISFQNCEDLEDNSNQEIFGLIETIGSDECIGSSLKILKNNSESFISLQRWESIHEKLESLEISLEMDTGNHGYLDFKKKKSDQLNNNETENSKLEEELSEASNQ